MSDNNSVRDRVQLLVQTTLFPVVKTRTCCSYKDGVVGGKKRWTMTWKRSKTEGNVWSVTFPEIKSVLWNTSYCFPSDNAASHFCRFLTHLQVRFVARQFLKPGYECWGTLRGVWGGLATLKYLCEVTFLATTSTAVFLQRREAACTIFTSKHWTSPQVSGCLRLPTIRF